MRWGRSDIISKEGKGGVSKKGRKEERKKIAKG